MALLLVPVPAADDVRVEFRCELRVTVPLMTLWVTIPPPPTSRVAILVEPLEAEVVVAVSVPDDEPVLEVEDAEVASVRRVDAVTCSVPTEAYEKGPPVKTADETSLPVNVTTAGLLEPLPLRVPDVEAEDASEVAVVLSEDCALVLKASRAASQILRGNMLALRCR